jgi:SAM-dependent methyltransferase
MTIDLEVSAQINRALYEFAQGYLAKRGWLESLDGVPRNREGFVPWITYPAFRQIERIVKPDWRVFEYGCGASSYWWAVRAGEVFSVEHDAAWAARVASAAPANLRITTQAQDAPATPEQEDLVAKFFADPPDLPLSPFPEHNQQQGLLQAEFVAYATMIADHPRKSFDAIVIDGMARALCAWLAPLYLKPGGIVIFDNADRWQYNGAFRSLARAGFRRLDFYGPGPVSRDEWCTAIFARSLDVFADNIDSPKGDSDLYW